MTRQSVKTMKRLWKRGLTAFITWWLENHADLGDIELGVLQKRFWDRRTLACARFILSQYPSLHQVYWKVNEWGVGTVFVDLNTVYHTKALIRDTADTFNTLVLLRPPDPDAVELKREN